MVRTLESRRNLGPYCSPVALSDAYMATGSTGMVLAARFTSAPRTTLWDVSTRQVACEEEGEKEREGVRKRGEDDLVGRLHAPGGLRMEGG